MNICSMGGESSYGEYLSGFDFRKLIFGQVVASFSESALLHSFELMTTRLQVNGDYRPSAVRAEVKRVHADGGVRSFYRGYGFTALMNVPIELLYRSTYDYNCRHVGHSPFLAGFLADTLISVIQVPAEVVSQRLQVAARGTRATDVIRRLYATDGFRGFYRTINIAILVHPFQAGAWWYSYELVRRYTGNSVVVSSVAASVVVSAMFNSVLVVKTQLQTGQSTLSGPSLFVQMAKSREGRLALLTAGLAPAMTKAVLEGVVQAYTYETVFSWSRPQSSTTKIIPEI